MKQRKITDTMQKVAASILSDFEVLAMTHDGPYTFEEIWEIVDKNADYYGLCSDPFTGMFCTSKEYVENSLEYERQVACAKYGHCDWLD
jgi:hypothetical protein